MAAQIYNILIVDDHPVVTAGMQFLLSEIKGFAVAATAGNAFDAMQLLKLHRIDVVLLDINLPDINGLDLCKKIKKELPDIKVIGISTYSDRSYILRMMDNGARGYLLKSAGKEEIEEALRTVMNGKIYLSIPMEKLLHSSSSLKENPLPTLTKREKQILKLIADGNTNQQIAAQLFISPLTVDSHRKSLLTKFEVNNTAALIKFAAEYHLLDE
ncbi:MAG TPA: response regulator transcription factor [Chitinophaga sp.]|uniref:response regulator transcription factor n=1 Tax=Chitinophaga sp. TaxID=1869181 RepID=UPI002DBAC3F5|nr:response regulator transcription factor [Chitinophaga sp.]HEU4555938.1 response regulator transcription factor [Chitinophaga sp.]